MAIPKYVVGPAVGRSFRKGAQSGGSPLARRRYYPDRPPGRFAPRFEAGVGRIAAGIGGKWGESPQETDGARTSTKTCENARLPTETVFAREMGRSLAARPIGTHAAVVWACAMARDLHTWW